MTITRSQLQKTLSAKDHNALRAVLDASEVRYEEGDGSERLADRLVAALWWRTHSPAGQVLIPDDLGQLLDRSARRLDLELGEGDTWSRLEALTTELLPAHRPISVDQLDPEVRKRLTRTIWLQLFGTAAAGGAAGSRIAAMRLLTWTSGPLWDLLLLLPKVGPALGTLKTGAGTVAAVSGPVGIALALASLNSLLGPRYDQALPLLLGVGLLCRNPIAQA